MKKSKFSESQIVAILKEGEAGIPVVQNKPKTLTPSAKREAVRIMVEQHGLSVSRACSSARLSRAAYYKPVQERGQADAEIVSALNEIVAVELRWGFWKCFDRLPHLGQRWNHKRVHRVYCQMRLNARSPTGGWPVTTKSDRMTPGRGRARGACAKQAT